MDDHGVETRDALTLGRKIGYGLGDLGFNLIWQTVILYLLFFYTDVFGISAGQAGMIFLIARVWDAVNDPMMGYLGDHTRTRWGRFRPYLLFGSVPLALAFIAAFSTPALGPTARFVYALVTYILVGMTYTMVNLPYSSLTAVMTQDADERSSLSAFRIVFAILGAAAVAIATIPLTKLSLFHDQRAGFQAVVAVYAVIALAICWITFAVTREKVRPAAGPSYRLKDIASIILTNRPLLFLAGATLFTETAGTMRMATGIFYVNYNVGREELFPYFALCLILATTVGAGLCALFAKKTSKRNLWAFGLVVQIIGDTGMFFTPYSHLVPIFAFLTVSGVGSGFGIVLMWSMVADTVEFAEWRTGIRADGIIYAAFSFVYKIGTAVGGWASGTILALTGYVARTPEMTAPPTQTPLALQGILAMLTLCPIAAALLSLAFLHFYRLDHQTFNQILAELESRKK